MNTMKLAGRTMSFQVSIRHSKAEAEDMVLRTLCRRNDIWADSVTQVCYEEGDGERRSVLGPGRSIVLLAKLHAISNRSDPSFLAQP
jgi:hypothetical protein